jgi:hypothetical protein
MSIGDETWQMWLFAFYARSRAAQQVVLLVELVPVQWFNRNLRPSSCATRFFWDNVPLFFHEESLWYLKKVYLLMGWVAVLLRQLKIGRNYCHPCFC